MANSATGASLEPNGEAVAAGERGEEKGKRRWTGRAGAKARHDVGEAVGSRHTGRVQRV